MNLPNKMELIFIYFNKLKFERDKKFTLEFSKDDKITEVLFKQSKDYFIISMDCFIKLSNDVKSSTQYKKIKEISDIANNIVISSIDFGFKFDDLIVKNFLRQDYNFSISRKHRSHWIFSFNKNDTRTGNVYSPHKELKTTRLKLESNSGNFGEYTLTLSDDLKKIDKLLKRQQIYEKTNTVNFIW